MIERKVLALLASGLMGASAQAGVYSMDFSAHGFFDVSGTGLPAPITEVSGSASWTAASQTAPIESLVSLNLTIGSHVFTLAGDAVTFLDGLATTSVIGGGAGGAPNSLTAGTDDFAITFDRTGLFYNFFYTQPTAATVWISQNGAVSISAVPETSTVLLLCAGLAPLGLYARGRRRPDAGVRESAPTAPTSAGTAPRTAPPAPGRC